jgi:hypothetical protein
MVKNMKKYVSCLKTTLIVLIGSAMLFVSCKDEDPKSSACDIVSFKVDTVIWTVSGLNIIHTYPPETEEGQLTPTIEVSKGATISPASGVAQNFFATQGVKYTVIAENGVTMKEYTVRARRTQYSGCEILSFTVDTVTWTVNGTDITKVYPPETVESQLTPTIEISRGATISPASDVAQNFFTAQGVKYTVTAENGLTMKEYTVKATRAQYSDCEILSFKVDTVTWTINGTNITQVYLPETVEGPLTPIITLSQGATVSPASGVVQSGFFSIEGVTYTVTAQDGVTKKTYTARATKTPYSDAEIKSFTVGETAWAINGSEITYVYPATTNTATPLTPIIALSPGATVNPASGVAQNFFTEAGVTYTVTAQDGVTKKTYTVKATKMPYSNNDIVSFTVGEATWVINGSEIIYVYPPETDPATPLTPIITLASDATVNPASGAAQNFFTETGVTYTVTAQDGATKTYTARATRTPYSGNDILSFTVSEANWVINGSEITYVYPTGTNPATPLTPIIALSPGATVNPASGVVQNFFAETGVTYTVTAENGTTKTYTVKARIISSASEIVSFRTDSVDWNIDGTDITAFFETTGGSLAPTISLSPGATVNPASGVTQNFFAAPVTYTVTAEDGFTQTIYTVKTRVLNLKRYDDNERKNWVAMSRNGNHNWGNGNGSQTLWPGGYPMLAIDNDLNSGWHSNIEAYASLPHVLIIDLKESKQVIKVSGSGDYFHQIELYLTDDLSINTYTSHTVDWNNESRKSNYDNWHAPLMGRVPETVPASWGSPIAKGVAETMATFSFTLSTTIEGQFLILRFPDNNSGGSSTYIDIFNIEVYYTD